MLIFDLLILKRENVEEIQAVRVRNERKELRNLLKKKF
jgi:hypothetical protein